MIDESIFVILSLGSNVGDRKQYIDQAVKLLIDSDCLKLIKISSYYETEPYGVKDQNWFLNIALSGYTNFNPFSLLQMCKSLEYCLDRKIRQRWHSREIDIDIIIYSNEIINTQYLKIPHPELEKRKFVLIPINEICPEFLHPVSNQSINQLLIQCQDVSKIDIIH